MSGCDEEFWGRVGEGVYHVFLCGGFLCVCLAVGFWISEELWWSHVFWRVGFGMMSVGVVFFVGGMVLYGCWLLVLYLDGRFRLSEEVVSSEEAWSRMVETRSRKKDSEVME